MTDGAEARVGAQRVNEIVHGQTALIVDTNHAKARACSVRQALPRQ